MIQSHTFEIFSANCPLCKNIEIIKNPECTQIIHDVNSMDKETKAKMEKYGINAVPTIVVDGKYKVVGVPDFSMRCGYDLFKRLEKDYRI
ncbi:MAG: thioredoxin family protein [Thaumarchaeota archaeon]|nr:thioredoxin family protein [Nitrososphaerota archaeon]MBI3642031.1 thioredoxin family protein [Nitrososphaerota archaeon]